MRQTLEEDRRPPTERGRALQLRALFRAHGAATKYRAQLAFEILGDRAIGSVVRTILGLPDEIAQLDIDKQAALIKSRIDIEDFKDPEKLQDLLTRFTTMWEINNPTASPQSMITTLFQPPQFGISPDVMMAIAKMRS
jgi:hypothetical protein